LEILSSFAISIAAGIALDITNGYTKTVDRQIKSAFQSALKDWSVNQKIRDLNEQRLKNILTDFIENSDGTFKEEIDKEIYEFIDLFEKRIAEKESAFNYLQSINDKQRYDEVISNISGLYKLIEATNIDPRDIEKYLKKLPFNKSKNEILAFIKDWYDRKRISLEIREILNIVVNIFFEHYDALTDEITQLKLEDNKDIIVLLENVQNALKEGNAEQIKQEYFLRKERISKENIAILKQSIKATEILFAFEQAIELNKELVELEPSGFNFLNLAYFLHKQNQLFEAEKYYKLALIDFRNPKKKNLEFNQPFIARIFNNLAIIQKAKNNFPQALENFQQSISIYENLGKDKLENYLFEVGNTLNNIANLYSDKNDSQKAFDSYQEALKMYKELAIKNPDLYSKNVAATLNNMANLHRKENELDKSAVKFEEALKICRTYVNKYPKTYLPILALVLNNFAALNSAKNEDSLAIVKCNEALKIRKELSIENPKLYLTDVAETLNNIGILYTNKYELSIALKNFTEALKIYKDISIDNPQIYRANIALTLCNMVAILPAMNKMPLAIKKYEEAIELKQTLVKENPKVYEIDFAQTLITGVELLKLNKINLKKAKDILIRYPSSLLAQKLLEKIKLLEK